MGNLITRLIHKLATCVTIHNVGDKPTVFPYTTFIAIVVSHIQRIGRQPGKTTLHSGQSRSSWSAEQENVYSSAYAIPVAYSFLYVPSMYVWSALSAEYDMDQPGVVASPARGHLKNSDITSGKLPLLQQNHACLRTGELYNCTRPLTAVAFRTAC